MSDEIIDIGRYRRGERLEEHPPVELVLWGAEGERARLTVPLWRILVLARAIRAAICWTSSEPGAGPRPFVVLGFADEDAATDLSDARLAEPGTDDAPVLHHPDSSGVSVYLGERDGRRWSLIADGGEGHTGPLDVRVREAILFLAGECAGLLFLRDLADQADQAD